MIMSMPRGFAPLIESDIFLDVHPVTAGTDPDPSAPRNRICRMCATEILLWGLREWWVIERRKGFLDEGILKRPDCPEGMACSRQKHHGAYMLPWAHFPSRLLTRALPQRTRKTVSCYPIRL